MKRRDRSRDRSTNEIKKHSIKINNINEYLQTSSKNQDINISESDLEDRNLKGKEHKKYSLYFKYISVQKYHELKNKAPKKSFGTIGKEIGIERHLLMD